MRLSFVTGDEIRKADPDRIIWPPDTILEIARDADDSVVGRSAIVILPHIEGTWVAEKMRGTPLAYRLVQGIEKMLKSIGRTHAFAFVYDEQPEVLDYMQRMNYKKLPISVLSKEI